jgi:hypothetical protein
MPNQPTYFYYFPQNNPQPKLKGPSNYLQTAYGPTGIATGLPPQNYQFPHVNKQLLFLATLDLPDLCRILNDPILHSPYCPVIPTKLPSNIPKFDSRSGEDPNNHVMKFHIWCLSNSLMDYSIRLRIFQCTLMGSTTKWYIEFLQGFLNDFNTLAMAFLTHYQWPIQCEVGTKILSSFKQSSSTHIYDHIHKWRRRRGLIKFPLPYQLLAEWFTKSLIGIISHDVSMGCVINEEKDIIGGQYFDLIYSQMSTLYDLIPDDPRPFTNSTPTPPVVSHAIDGVIRTFHAETHSKQANHYNPKSTTSNLKNANPMTPSLSKNSEVNTVQSTPSGKNKNEKKGKGKNKEDKANNQQSDKTKTHPVDDKENKKPCYPFLIYGEDHYTKYFSRRVEVTKFLQGIGTPPTPAILSQPFPSQQQAKLVIHDQPSTSTMSYVLMCTGDYKKKEVAVITRTIYYSPSKEKVYNSSPPLVQPPPSTSPPNSLVHLERTSLDTVLCPPPKGFIRKSSINPHAHVAETYSSVEVLANTPSTMLALEVLQSCPMEWKALLKAIGGIDPTDTNLIVSDLEYHIPRLPHQLDFQIQVIVENKNIFQTIVDEGASTCVMSITCWKAIVSPALTE